jgi:hypothetical protein
VLDVRFVESPARPEVDRLRAELADVRHQLEQAQKFAAANVPVGTLGVSDIGGEKIPHTRPPLFRTHGLRYVMARHPTNRATSCRCAMRRSRRCLACWPI